MMLEHYSTGRIAETRYPINNSMRVKLKGARLEQFINTWQTVRAALRVRPSEEIIEKHFTDNHKDCT